VSLFTVTLVIVFILVIVPILYWILISLNRLIRHLGRRA
jgi:hypothetical protein